MLIIESRGGVIINYYNFIQTVESFVLLVNSTHFIIVIESLCHDCTVTIIANFTVVRAYKQTEFHNWSLFFNRIINMFAVILVKVKQKIK